MKVKGVDIEFLGHAGFLISSKDKKIAIDPYNLSNKVPKVDLILITHSHYDHCSIKDIEKIAGEETTIVVTPDSQSKITKLENVNMQIIEAGDELNFDGLKVEAVPAYNPNKKFHPKNEGWLGYLMKFDKLTIYHAGDTDKTKEMEKLTGYGKKGHEFVALLPVSGTYVMDADEAAEVAEMLNPNIAIPMHYGAGVAGTEEDAKRFCEMCMRKGIRAEVLEKI